MVKIINITRNIHFIIFNLVLIDGVFYTSRIISHIKFVGAQSIAGIESDSQKLNLIVSYIFLMCLGWDLLKLFLIGISLGARINPYHKEYLDKRSEIIELVLIRQFFNKKYGQQL